MQFLCKRKEKSIVTHCQSLLIQDEVHEDELDAEEEDFCEMPGNFVIEFHFK